MTDLRRPDGVVKTPLKSIRKFCLECMSGSSAEVEKCTAPKCWLYPYRSGKHPTRASKMTKEQKKAAGERLKAYHNKKNKKD